MLVALDQGTTSTRAIVFDVQRLTPLFVSQREFTQHYPQDGWVEHDLEEIWTDVQFVLGEARAWIAANGGTALALGITNQRETIALWERDSGKPLHNAIVWQDRRTAARCEQLREEGHLELINKKTGLLLDPYFSATKLAWLLDHAGTDLRGRAERGEILAGTIDTFLIWRLTAGKVFATDVTNASRTQLCELQSMSWDDELLALHNVPRACLPEIRDNAADFGTTALLGDEVPIGGVAGDQQSAALGQACLSTGATKATYGTGCFVIVQGGTEVLRPGNGLLGTVGFRVGDRHAYAVEGSIFVAGAAVKWLRDQLGFFAAAFDSEELAQSAPEDNKLFLVPAFTGLGAPHWNPAARATLVGMTLDTDRAAVTRATLASIAYSTADLTTALALEGSAPSSVSIDGGMAANNWFAQYLADTIDLPVSRPLCIETTAMGAAFLAGLQAGVYSSLDDIAKLRKEERGFTSQWSPQQRKTALAGWHRAVQTTLNHAATA